MMEGTPIVPQRLEYRDIVGAGKQIHVYVDQEVPCVEFTMKKDYFQNCLVSCEAPYIVFTEPFIQFRPENWNNMQEQILKQMVDLWNEKYGRNNPVREEQAGGGGDPLDSSDES